MKLFTKLFIYFLALLSLQLQCGHSHDGFVSISKDIEESKKRKVFLNEYKVEKITDLDQLKKVFIDEIFLEKLWRRKNFNLSTSLENTGECTQLKINFTNDSFLSSYGKDWFLGNSFDLNFRKCSKISLMANFKSSIPDTLVVPILSQENFKKNESLKIGELILAKKYPAVPDNNDD